jgi:nucleotide-binding universal stress UspA family protein
MMKMPRQVLATLDQSKLSEVILPYLPGVLRYGDEVVLLTVGRPPQAIMQNRIVREQPLVVGPTVEILEPMAQPYAEDRERAIERQKNELLDYLWDRGLMLRNEGFTVRPMVMFDERPARAIVNCARELGPLFIAMATHGRSGVGHAISGSIAEEVVKSRVAPVLLVRP